MAGRNPTVAPLRARTSSVESSRWAERREPLPEDICPSCGRRVGVVYLEGEPHCVVCWEPIPEDAP